MTWRTNRPGRRNPIQIETLPPDELPEGVAATPTLESPEERTELGRFAPGSRTAQSKGGLTRKKTVKLGRRLGLADSSLVLPEFAPYRNAAIAFKKSYVAYLAETVGGGICSSGPASIIASSAWQLALSRFMFDKVSQTGNMQLGITASKLANDSKLGLMGAWELCAREAKARQSAEGDDSIFAEQLKFQKELAKKKKKVVEPEFIVNTDGEETE